MDKIKPIFTVAATSVGGRTGHSETSDNVLTMDFSMPAEMGGPGTAGTVTPEHLFALGYAACFGGALSFTAEQRGKDASHAKTTCRVSIGKRAESGFALSVKMFVEDTTLPQADLDALVKEAHEKICPYSHATRNNVEVLFDVKGA